MLPRRTIMQSLHRFLIADMTFMDRARNVEVGANRLGLESDLPAMQRGAAARAGARLARKADHMRCCCCCSDGCCCGWERLRRRRRRSTLDVSLAEILSAHFSTNYEYMCMYSMIVVRIEAASVADVTRR